MSHWYRKGKRVRKVAIDDRALQYGDGLFETVAIREAEPRLWDYHRERLAAGCQRLGIEMPADGQLRAWLASAVQKNPQLSAYCIAKIIVSSGTGERGYGRNKAAGETLIGIFPAQAMSPQAYRDGVDTILCDTRLALYSATAGLKTLNRLEQVLARSECLAADTFEGIVLGADDRLICGTMSNVFIVAGQSIITPSLERCGVEGVMRRHTIETLLKAGLEVAVRDVAIDELWASDEVFMINSQFGLLPVKSCGQHNWSVGPMTRQALALLADNGITEFAA